MPNKKYFAVNDGESFNKGYIFENEEDFKRFKHANDVLATNDIVSNLSYFQTKKKYQTPEYECSLIHEGGNYPYYDTTFRKLKENETISFIYFSDNMFTDCKNFITSFKNLEVTNTLNSITNIFELAKVKDKESNGSFTDKVWITIRTDEPTPHIGLFREFNSVFFNYHFYDKTRMDLVKICDENKDILVTKYIKQIKELEVNTRKKFNEIHSITNKIFHTIE